MWSQRNGKAAVRGPPLPLADSTSAERGMFSRAGPARRPRRPGDAENSVDDAAARDFSAACSSSTSCDSPAAAFSVGQPPSHRGRDRQPRWSTGYGSPGTAAAPRAPQTTTATARAAHTVKASPMMMTSPVRERQSAARARIVDVVRAAWVRRATHVSITCAEENQRARRRGRRSAAAQGSIVRQGCPARGGRGRGGTREPSRGRGWPW